MTFSLLARIFGECLTIHSLPALFFLFFVVVVVVLKWQLACAHSFLSLCQDQPTVAQWAEMTVAESLISCAWVRFWTNQVGQGHKSRYKACAVHTGTDLPGILNSCILSAWDSLNWRNKLLMMHHTLLTLFKMLAVFKLTKLHCWRQAEAKAVNMKVRKPGEFTLL